MRASPSTQSEASKPDGGPSGDHAPAAVERAGPGGEGPSALERFERRAEKIARAAEVGVIAGVQHETDLLAALVEKRLPEVGDERGLSGGNPAEQARGENAHARVHEGPAVAGPEARDAIPFGLKRRVPLGVSVFSHQQGRRAAGVPVAAEQLGDSRARWRHRS